MGGGSERAFMYDRESDTWTEVSDMEVGRQYHSCGIDSAKNEIVVAGGVNDALPLSSVEIFMVSSMSWRDGESLPFALAGSYATRFGVREEIQLKKFGLSFRLKNCFSFLA